MQGATVWHRVRTGTTHSSETRFYGLRGIRLGEATNPGPSDVVTAVDALEFDLTLREVVVEASHPNPSQEAPTQWDFTARDAETEDETV